MNLKHSKFSVLLPILERKDIIEGFPKALESIYKNTILPDQVVVTVDGKVSSFFKDLIVKYQEKYNLDLIWIPEKVGLDKALNIGLEKCNNEYVFRADGDDINHKDRFEEQLPFLYLYDVVGSNIDEYDQFGNYISTRFVPKFNEEISKMMPFRNPINHMSVAFKKSKVMEVGGYPNLFLKGDYGLWIKLKAANFKFYNLEKSLVNASTGDRMIKDRGGARYILSELLLQKYLLQNGLTNLITAFLIFFLRSIVFISPVYLRSFIYKKFLRINKKL